MSLNIFNFKIKLCCHNLADSVYSESQSIESDADLPSSKMVVIQRQIFKTLRLLNDNQLMHFKYSELCKSCPHDERSLNFNTKSGSDKRCPIAVKRFPHHSQEQFTQIRLSLSGTHHLQYPITLRNPSLRLAHHSQEHITPTNPSLLQTNHSYYPITSTNQSFLRNHHF